MIRLASGSRWLSFTLLIAALAASTPEVRRCLMPSGDVGLAALAQCSGCAAPAVHTTGCSNATDCPLRRAATAGDCDAACAAATRECATKCAAATSRTFCLLNPALSSVWRPRVPQARRPDVTAILIAPPLVPRPESAATSCAFVLPRAAARSPDARPPVRGPPSAA